MNKKHFLGQPICCGRTPPLAGAAWPPNVSRLEESFRSSSEGSLSKIPVDPCQCYWSFRWGLPFSSGEELNYFSQSPSVVRLGWGTPDLGPFLALDRSGKVPYHYVFFLSQSTFLWSEFSFCCLISRAYSCT